VGIAFEVRGIKIIKEEREVRPPALLRVARVGNLIHRLGMGQEIFEKEQLPLRSPCSIQGAGDRD